jgi:sensor histidine kinase YesM
MNSKNIYWLCQLAGWFGMVGIETINYTFFIVGKFSTVYFWAFIQYAVVGILATHTYRYILKRSHFFEKKAIQIWLYAFLSTFIISAVLALVNFIPSMFEDFSGFIKQVRVVDIAGTIINWGRYAGVWVIIYFMYKILQQNSTIQQEKLKLENLAKTTELELLKTQLNPHFLFNALNSIKALVIINPEQSRDAIVKLSELLRFTLQYGKEQLIPVKDEMQEVKKYLELEQLRFGKRLTVTYEIEENTLSQTLPPAIVLTLAENAVKHGVAKQMEDGFIHIKTSIINNFFQIEVSNNGKYQPTASIGIGLKHVSKRLEEIYHPQAIFSIAQLDNKVRAIINTPVSWQ